MAPAPDEFSGPGAVSYDSDTMTVGDGTWDFSKNTFLLPNLQGTNFDTTRYNGMGNRFSTFKEYHTIVLAHGIMAAFTFLFFVPVSVMIVRFYSGRPGNAVRYHAQLQILSCLFLLAIFILGFFAVGPNRSLSNPHHGIGVAIFVLFLLQLVGGRLVRSITKVRSLRIMIHQWSGRAIALLGVVQVPLGLTLYGSPKYLFILYAVWMAFLVFVYFILSYRSAGRRELYMTGGRSEAGHTRVTESEYFASERSDAHHHSNKWKWLGGLAATAGLWKIFQGRKKSQDRGRASSLDRSSRGPEVLPSTRGSDSFLDDEKYSSVAPRHKSGGGGFMKLVGGAAAAVGAGKLVSSFMDRRDRHHDEEYSAVSTETPRRHRPTRGTGAYSEFDSEVTGGPGASATDTSLLPPSAQRPRMAGARSAVDSDYGPERPHTPRASHARYTSGPEFEDSEYSSYVSPSRRPRDESRAGGGVAKGLMAGLGMGWISKKLAERRARKDDEKLRDEEELRSGAHGARFTGDGYPSPARRNSHRPPLQRRSTGAPGGVYSELTESTVDSRPDDGYGDPVPPMHAEGTPTRASRRHSRSQSQSQSRSQIEPVSMPAMPPDPRGVLHSEAGRSHNSGRPKRRPSSRRRRAAERAAAAAAARASDLAVEERDRYGSAHSQPLSVKLKVHDDRDRNVTLRRLTEEEARAARGQRDRADSESSLTEMESPSHGRHYRRDPSQRRAEVAAEQRAEEDHLAPLSPPNPAFAKGRRGKDSAYYSGQPDPSGASVAAGHTVSSLGSMASPESHGTWSGASPVQSGTDRPAESAAADNRRRRRLERRRGSSSRPTGTDMFD